MKSAHLLPVLLALLLSSCDKPAASVEDAEPADNKETKQNNDATPHQKPKELSPKDNPLVARRHLPLPERLCGLRFISNESAQKGYAPGPMAEGYYFLDFGYGWLTWTHADVADAFEFKMDEMGVFVATRGKEEVEGHFDSATGVLTWDSQSYRIYTATPKEPKAGDDGPPALTEIAGGLKLNLESTRLESKTVGVGLGSLNVTTLGHHDGYVVFDYTPECEGGFSVFRHRLPIREKTATIKVNTEVQVTASFDTTKSKKIHAGNMLFGGPVMFLGWTSKWITPKLGVSIQDIVAGDGAVAEVGKTVEVRCMFYTDEKYVKLDDRLKQDRQMSLKLAKGDGASYMDVAIEGTRAGGWRRARGQRKLATKLLPEGKAIEQDEMLSVEFQLISVE